MIVVVGGAGRNSGKTSVICDILSAMPEARWTAIKLTSDAHGADLREPLLCWETVAGSRKDTERFLAAGAERSVWIRTPGEALAAAVRPLTQGNVLIESNSVLDVLEPDLFLFVQATPEASYKPSAGKQVARADAIVVGAISAGTLQLIRARLEAGRSAESYL